MKQAVFEAEVQDRLKREAKIAADLAAHEAETKEAFELERVCSNHHRQPPLPPRAVGSRH